MSHPGSSNAPNAPGGRNGGAFKLIVPRGQWPFAVGLIGIILFAGAMTVDYGIRLHRLNQASASHGPGCVKPGCDDDAKHGGFDLSTSLVPASEILAGGPPKDGIPALTAPDMIPAIQARYLNDDDRVIGVSLDGQARAYPLRVLNWHENVNDEVGGTPIAVTYCPLCDSAVVFDRRVGGQLREFGISGLLYNSNVLLYDRHKNPRDESLWSQLQMRAVTGPAAREGLKLTPLPAELTTWRDWADRHPHTTVLSERTGHQRSYDANPYDEYFQHDLLMFPVEPLPPAQSGLRNKDRLLVVRSGDQMRAYPVKIIEQAGAQGITDVLGGQEIHLTYDRHADSIRVIPSEESEEKPSLLYTFWFAWHAMHPDVEVYGLSTRPAQNGIPTTQEANHHADH